MHSMAVRETSTIVFGTPKVHFGTLVEGTWEGRGSAQWVLLALLLIFVYCFTDVTYVRLKFKYTIRKTSSMRFTDTLTEEPRDFSPIQEPSYFFSFNGYVQMTYLNRSLELGLIMHQSYTLDKQHFHSIFRKCTDKDQKFLLF